MKPDGSLGPGSLPRLKLVSQPAFSATCRDTLTYKSYVDCRETNVFLGWDLNRARWYCSSLQAGNKFQVAEAKRRR